MPLFFAVVKYSRTVLCTHIAALPVKRGWVMAFKERQQQVTVGDHIGIKLNVNNFSMAGFAVTYFHISRVWGMPAGISRLYFYNTFLFLKNRFGAPETTVTKCCFLNIHLC